MYACLHLPRPAPAGALVALALEFSPVVEETAADTIVFSIAGLRRLLGSPHQIASEISRSGHERKLEANLAIAANIDTAVLLARHSPGVTLAGPGEERGRLAAIPLTALLTHDIPVDPKLLDILRRWGLKTCEELAALPEDGVAERLGVAGVYLRNLACGAIQRPLRIPASVTSYEERIELEHPLHLLEPLLFLLGSTLGDLCRRLRSQSMAARALETQLELEQNKTYRSKIEFPVPLEESPALLKLLQLYLECHPPEAPVVAFTLRIKPAAPKRIQHGFFVPPAPPADKLQLTLARIAGMVGKENVGTPALLNTHRPDAFELRPYGAGAEDAQANASEPAKTLRLAMRLFRPALPARVRLVAAAPKSVSAPGVKGTVLQCAGPWKTSGEWWAATWWTREEWDVALDDGALYRIYLETRSRAWYVHAVYD